MRKKGFELLDGKGGIIMITNTEIKIKGLQILTELLGEREAERFIALIQREPFDYTNGDKGWMRISLLRKSAGRR